MMPLEPKKQNVLRLHLLAAPMMISFIVHGILLLLLMSTHFDNLVIRDSWLLSEVREPGEIIQTSVTKDASVIPLEIDPCEYWSFKVFNSLPEIASYCIPPNNWIIFTYEHVIIIKPASYIQFSVHKHRVWRRNHYYYRLAGFHESAFWHMTHHAKCYLQLSRDGKRQGGRNFSPNLWICVGLRSPGSPTPRVITVRITQICASRRRSGAKISEHLSDVRHWSGASADIRPQCRLHLFTSLSNEQQSIWT